VHIECRGLFAEYRLFYRALLQKRPIIFIDATNRSHPIETLSCIQSVECVSERL